MQFLYEMQNATIHFGFICAYPRTRTLNIRVKSVLMSEYQIHADAISTVSEMDGNRKKKMKNASVRYLRTCVSFRMDHSLR